MNLSSLETLSRLSNFVQVSVLVLLFLSAFLQVSKFVLDSQIKKLKEVQVQKRFLSIESRPSFDQNMWKMVTGIPAEVVRDFHAALDLFDSGDYVNCSKLISSVIDTYEGKEDWDLKGCDLGQRKMMVGEIYTLAARVSTHIGNHESAYAYAGKALRENQSYFSYYSAAVAAYNLKKYHEALEKIDRAISLKPPSLELDGVFEEIRKRCLKHLEQE